MPLQETPHYSPISCHLILKSEENVHLPSRNFHSFIYFFLHGSTVPTLRKESLRSELPHWHEYLQPPQPRFPSTFIPLPASSSSFYILLLDRFLVLSPIGHIFPAQIRQKNHRKLSTEKNSGKRCKLFAKQLNKVRAAPPSPAAALPLRGFILLWQQLDRIINITEK